MSLQRLTRSMSLFENRELADQTKDITQRFEGERRPQPAGLDQALGFGNSHRQSGSQLPPTAPKYAARGGGFVTGKGQGINHRSVPGRSKKRPRLYYELLGTDKRRRVDLTYCYEHHVC